MRSTLRRRRPVLGMLLVAAVALSSCSSAGSASDPATTAAQATTTTSPTSAVDCSPARSAESATSRTLVDQGLERTYDIDLPDAYDGTHELPVILDFHGFAGSKEKQEANAELAARGSRRGFIVVTPDAEEIDGAIREWTLFGGAGRPDDFAYVHRLIEDLAMNLCIDRGRIYAAGHSNGSAFAGLLVCTAPYVFAAVAMVSATTPAGCPDGVAPAVLAIAGTADPQVPFDGGSVGGSSTSIPPVPAVIERYARQYECDVPGAVDDAAAGVRRTRYANCTDGAEVVLDVVDGGTHEWPGGAAAKANPADSAAGRGFDATGEILDFFSHHRRHPPS